MRLCYSSCTPLALSYQVWMKGYNLLFSLLLLFSCSVGAAIIVVRFGCSLPVTVELITVCLLLHSFRAVGGLVCYGVLWCGVSPYSFYSLTLHSIVTMLFYTNCN